MREKFTLIALHGLVETFKDCEQNFLLCARQTDVDDLTERFVERANRARKCAHELQTYINEYGGGRPAAGTWTGVLHRAWLRLRGALFGPPDGAWLDECQHAERVLLGRLRVAMETPLLCDKIYLTIERQFYAWQHVHDQKRSLHGVLKAST